MNASILHFSEPVFHEIVNFVATSLQSKEKESLYSSLRQLGKGVLKLDEMLLGQCTSATESVHPQQCSDFDPMVYLTEETTASSWSPCGSARTTSGHGNAHDHAGGETCGSKRVMVCHRRTVGEPSLCIVSSGQELAPEELQALLKTLLPYVHDALHRMEPEQCSDPDHALADLSRSCTTSTASLTSREREILHWTAQGKGCWETGLIVGISERTVKFHLQNIYRKLNVVNRAQAVAKAAQTHLL
jgi:DNA-binding CsgD family transcriptional regulator